MQPKMGTQIDDDRMGHWDLEWFGVVRTVMMTVWAPGTWSGLVI